MKTVTTRWGNPDHESGSTMTKLTHKKEKREEISSFEALVFLLGG
jgi:hypothetical protein